MPLEHQLIAVLVAIIGFALISKRWTQRWLTMPMAFTALGLVGGQVGLITFNPEMELIHVIAEATLVLVLFADASRIQLRALRREAGLPVRLLSIGLPLTIALGTLAAVGLFPTWTIWEAALLGAILAPTDAALGQAVVSSPAVPQRIRQALNVESGLNDGIALPVVLLLIALGIHAEGSAGDWLGFWAMQVLLGPLVGAVIGAGVGALLKAAHDAGWSEPTFSAIGGLAAAALCYVAAEAVGGNGFMAAFVGGVAFGWTAGAVLEDVHRFIERDAELLMVFVFLLLGCALAVPALTDLSPRIVVYAILSLTVVRMVPVMLSLLGAGTSTMTVAFVGWFGPRGLASLLFGLLLLEEHELTHGHEVFQVVIVTVLASVFLHGGSAAWASERYGATVEEGAVETKPVTAHPLRRERR